MSFLLYGAYGYTGQLIAEYAVEQGLSPILAGRNAEKLQVLAGELNLPYRAFELSDRAVLGEAVEDVPVVMHCAGPFTHTAAPMVGACLRTGTHYLDITGEIGVFEALAEEDAAAKDAGVMLLPGIGFDVVPTDCLAAYLHERVPEATQLEIAIFARGGISRGTATTAIEQLGRDGVARRNGTLVRVPLGWKTRTVDFGEGPVEVTAIPWGDIATAYRSTGIPNITTYIRLPKWVQSFVKVGSYFGGVLGSKPVQRALRWSVRRGEPGPTAAERVRGESFAWGEVMAPDGQHAEARLRGPESYRFTKLAAVAAIQHVLDGDTSPGYQTPATAFGADFALEIDGVVRTEVT